MGIGLLGGIGTGMGYLVSLTVPVKSFPQKKGLITGVVVAGFGAGAILLTYLADFLFKNSVGVLHVFLYWGTLYGLIIILAAQQLKTSGLKASQISYSSVTPMNGVVLFKLILGIFAGTFTGLLIIGNLKPIAQMQEVSMYAIPLAISLFALSNFTGRIVWGWMSDRIGNTLLIPTALLVQGAVSMSLFSVPVSDIQFISLIILIGFCFGAHFVLFAKDTIQMFGIDNYAKIYPFIFLGYGFAGIAGPFIGGWVVDLTGEYMYAILLAFTLSIVATFIYVFIDKKVHVTNRAFQIR
ncbi:Cyanate permease [Saccharicrinis carchari]|uniref:Cyanate permease n=2 Tax=Saccharicrinis carchari TaxID=1168039 RepID=A0A521EHH1_SACCC|nr:MFS transporter [Saccharicrinis carchari]SMO83374.1 Cyanate permease [Saccharicrinis carchari]